MIRGKATIFDITSKMNKLEARYAAWLEREKNAGRIKFWGYETMRLKLGDGTFYTPDFTVVMANDVIEIHETKGFMREAARVRLRVAASLHPFLFRLVKEDRPGQFVTEVVFHG